MDLFYRISMKLLGLLPLQKGELLHGPACFLVGRLIKYRSKVIDRNLQIAFQNEPSQDRDRIKNKYYSTLVDYLGQTLHIYSKKDVKPSQFCTYENPNLITEQIKKGRSVVIMASHLGNWELAAMALPRELPCPVKGIYMPLANKAIDRQVRKARSRWGLILVPVRQLLKHLNTEQVPSVYILIADQSPSDKEYGEKCLFFDEETYFNKGINKIKERFGVEVLYQQIKNTESGYNISFVKAEKQIIKGFVKDLEEQIRNYPHMWLWSHRRWKLTKDY